MTHIEELKAALTLIRNECKTHTCSNCPLCGISCGRDVYYPIAWPIEELGDEDNE